MDVTELLYTCQHLLLGDQHDSRFIPMTGGVTFSVVCFKGACV